MNDDSELVTKILNNYALIKPINARPYIIRSASSASFRLKDPLRRDPIIKSIFFILCLFFMDWPLLSASVNSDKAKVKNIQYLYDALKYGLEAACPKP